MNTKEKITNALLGILGVVLFIGIIGYGVWWVIDLFSKKPWMGKYNSSMEKFKTLEDCRAWAKSEAGSDGKKEGEYTFECGKNCKYTGREAGKITDNYNCEELINN